MGAFDIVDESQLTHVRELKTAVAKLKAENARLRDENAQLLAHLDLAVLAARELETLPAEGKLLVIDGWNLILGARSPSRPKRENFNAARDRRDLEDQARAHLAAHPADFVWIVLDGPRFATRLAGRVRVTYTGGSGQHRADRFICDFLRMARFRNVLDRIEVRTNDRDFLAEVKRLYAEA